jgi:hypothetical protein
MSRLGVSLGLATIVATGIGAQPAVPRSAVATLPVKEVSIFKDGHAFVLHEGAVPVDPSGSVVLDYLPVPVLGTFWAYAVDRRVTVAGVAAGQRQTMVEQTARRLIDLLEANVGASVVITEKPGGTGPDGLSYPATILALPNTPAAAPPPAGSGPATPPGGISSAALAPVSVDDSLVLLQTAGGVKALPVGRIQDVTFKTPPKATIARPQSRDLMTLSLDWGKNPPASSAEIGLVYLQKGLRWIPSYRVAIDGKGSANVKLQAIIINELADLSGVTASLVVGVPSFAFENTLDPVSLRTSNPLSGYFQKEARPGLSNAIASQGVMLTRGDAVPALDPALATIGGAQSEDLFLFPVRNLTVAKGQRLTLPVTEQNLPYTDVYTVNLPISPPPDIRGNVPSDQQADVARMLAAPGAVHKIRLKNTTGTPLTTAPALVVRGDQVLSQNMVTYTSPGAGSDLEIGKAVDIQVVRAETETARTPNAVRVSSGESLVQVQLTGSITLTNRRKERVSVEVVRKCVEWRSDRQVEHAVGIAGVVAVLQLAAVVQSDERHRPHYLAGRYRAGAERGSDLRLVVLLAITAGM